MAKAKDKPVTDPVNDNQELAAANLLPEKEVFTIIGNANWKGQDGIEHVVSGNVANAIIGKGWAELKA